MSEFELMLLIMVILSCVGLPLFPLMGYLIDSHQFKKRGEPFDWWRPY